MHINYLNILLPGIIGGFIIGFLQVISCCGWPLDLIILFLAGLIAVYLSKPDIAVASDSTTIGMLGGGFTGLAGGIVYAAMAVFMTMLIGSISIYNSNNSSFGSVGVLSFLAGAGGIVCCLPTFIVGGIILGGLAGMAYASMVLKM